MKPSCYFSHEGTDGQWTTDVVAVDWQSQTQPWQELFALPSSSLLTGHVWSAAGHYPALPFPLHTWTAHLIPLTLQWGVNHSVFPVCQCWLITACLPKITPFCLLSPLSRLAPVTTILPRAFQTPSWRVRLSWWTILSSVSCSALWAVWKPQSLREWLFCQDEDSWELTLQGPGQEKELGLSHRLVFHLRSNVIFFPYIITFFLWFGTYIAFI